MNSSSFWFRAALLHVPSAVARQRVGFPSALVLARNMRVVCCSDGSTCSGVQIMSSSLAFNCPLLRQNDLHQTSSPVRSPSQRTENHDAPRPSPLSKGRRACCSNIKLQVNDPIRKTLPSSLLCPPSYSARNLKYLKIMEAGVSSYTCP